MAQQAPREAGPGCDFGDLPGRVVAKDVPSN
jgi:hypothetical protein